MPTIEEYDAWEAQQRERANGQTSAVLHDARNTNPDDFAGAVNLGKAFGLNPTLASAGRDMLETRLNKLRESSVLSLSPRTAQWLRDSDNAKLAWDDLDNLSWFEGAARGTVNTAVRTGNRVGQMGNQYMLELNTQRNQDRSRTFGEILDTERQTVKGPNDEDVKLWPKVGDLLGAGARYIDARFADLIGTNDAENARQSAALLQQNLDAMNKASPGSLSTRFRESLKGDTLGEALQNVGNGIVSNPLGAITFGLEMLAESSPQLAAAVGTTAVTRNPTLGLGVLGSGSYLTERFTSPAEFFQEKGLDLSKPVDIERLINDPALMKEAADRGVIRGAIIGAFDAISGGLAGRAFARNPLIEAIAQSAQQAIGGAGGEYVARRAAGQKIDWGEIVAEGFGEIFTAPVDMGIAGRKLAAERKAAGEGETARSTIDGIAETAAASKLRQRVPGNFQRFVDNATAGTPIQDIYIPAERMQELFQSFRFDPQEFLSDIPGVDPTEWATALATGGDIKIPTGSYAATISGSDLDAQLRDHIRFSPEAMTAAEAREFNARADDAQMEAFQDAENLRVAEDANRAIDVQEFDELVGRLRGAGRSLDVARAEALPIVAMRRTMASRAGIDPAEFSSRYSLPEVRRAVPAGMQSRNIDELTRELAEMRQFVAKPDKRGKSLLEFISDRGGINDEGGELRSRNAETVSRGKGKKSLKLARQGFVAGMKDMIGGGGKFGFDDVAQAAIDAGYLSNDPVANEYRHALETGGEAPDIGRALLGAIDEALRGNDDYAGGAQADPRAAIVEDNVRYLDSLGVSLNDTDETIRAAIEQAQGKGRQFQQGRRGSIQLPLAGAEGSPVIISLFENADLSTLLHESGHYFLSVLEDMAMPPGVSPEIVQMHQQVKAWWKENSAGVADEAKSADGMEVSAADVSAYLDQGTSGDAAKDRAIETGTHEQFARAFESYLLEGKAPSIELRSAFERFTQWLVRLYRNLRGLNVNVSPELKTVFDRLLATDDEIQAARADVSDDMLFQAAETAGISADDYRHLTALHDQARDEAHQKLRREIMAPIVREREQWYRAERAKVSEEVTARLQSWPVYRAIQEMRFGKDFDGNEVPAVKLDRATVEKEYGAGHIPFLPGATRQGRGHLNAVFTANGVHPDIAAGMFGFTDGRTMLEEMENAQPIKDAITAETDRIMYERHGDVLRDGEAEEKALEAIHGDKRGQFLAAELGILNRKVGGQRTTSQEAREAVRRTIGHMRMRNAASPNRFLAAERKAANDAAIAVAKDDFKAAAEAKRRQLLNYHFYMEAKELEGEVESVINRLSRLNKRDEQLSKTRDVNFVKAARAIAGKFGLANAPSDFDMLTWMEQLKLDDPVSHDALSQAIYVQTRGGATPYRDLTVDEFKSTRDAIDNLLEVGRLSREAEIDGQKMDLGAIRDELTSIAAARSKGKNVALERRLNKMEKVKIKALSILAALRRVEAWARDMDDGKAGAYTRYIINPIMDSVGVYRQEKAKRLREMLDILEPRKADLLGGAIRASELGYTFENKGELLHAILHTGNESNKRKLLVGRNWEGRWDAFIDRMHREGIVTKADYDTAQAIWDLMERMKRPAQSAHKRMYGFYFNEIEAAPVETPFGTYKGGYVPAIADRDASVDGTIRADQEALEGQNSAAMFPTTGRGFTKSRVEGYATPLALDIIMLPSHMDRVLRFIHINPAIRQTARIVGHRGFREAINEVSPGIIESMVTPWLQRTAQQAVETQTTSPAGRAFAGAAREVRRRVGTHAMFLNVVNTVQQVTGFSSAMILVKPGRLKSALIRFTMGDGGTMREEATQLSRFMEDRIINSSREMHGRIQDAIVKPGAMGIIREKSDKYGYVLQQGAQNVIDVIVWHGAYDQAVANGMDQADAVREADSVIRRSMGSFAPEDISAAEGGNAFVRLFSQFYSYFNGQANLVFGELQTIMRSYGYQGAPKMFAVYMFGIAIPAIVGQAIVEAASGGMGDDDDDGYADELLGLLFGSQFRYVAGMVPGLGQGANVFLNTWNDKPYDDRLSLSPAATIGDAFIGAPKNIYKAVIGEGSTGKAAKDGIAALGLILGIPAGQLAKLAGYAGDVSEGRARPQSATDVMQGVLTGRDGTK